jgi:hypothetical protein
LIFMFFARRSVVIITSANSSGRFSLL